MEQANPAQHLYANARLTTYRNGVLVKGSNRSICITVDDDSSLVIGVRRTIPKEDLGNTPHVEVQGWKILSESFKPSSAPCFAYTRAGITILETTILMTKDSSEVLHGALDMVLRGIETGHFKAKEETNSTDSEN